MIDLKIPGQMTEIELQAVESIARRVPKGGNVVEAGSLFGLSSYTWATTVDPSVTVHCIDPWVREPWVIDLVENKIPGCPEFSYEAFQHFTRSCSNIVPRRGYSPQDFKDWSIPVDVFFDDAMHHDPFFTDSIEFWKHKVLPGGVMCGHDYCSEWPDVMRGVDKLAGELGATVNTQEWFWWIDMPLVSSPKPKRKGWWKW